MLKCDTCVSCERDIKDQVKKNFKFGGYRYCLCLDCAIASYQDSFNENKNSDKTSMYHRIDGNKITYFYEDGTELVTQAHFKFTSASGWKRAYEKEGEKMDENSKVLVESTFSELAALVDTKVADEIKNTVHTEDDIYDEYLSEVKYLRAQSDYDLIIQRLQDLKNRRLPADIYANEITKISADLIFYLVRTKNYET